jgi:signal transduction histidine kinase
VSARPYTLRARLTVSMVAVLALVLGLFSVVLYAAFGRALWRALDARLDAEGRALAEMAETDQRGRMYYEMEGISALPDFDDLRPPAYFEVWLSDGTVLARSRSLGQRDLPAMTAPAVWRGTLPDGRAGRMATAAYLSHESRRAPGRRERMTVTVARGTEAEDAALAHLRNLLWGLGVLAVAVAAGAAAFTVSRGLRPAAALALALDGVDAKHLQRLDVPNLPRELEPAVTKLNELLARLDDSFARERRFTSDVSHELRTPLAGLRSLLEVAASRERTAPEYRTVIEQAMDIVRQMHRLAEELLMLARLDANQIQVRREPIALGRFVDDCWQPFIARAGQRGLRFENTVGPDATTVSDRDKLRLVLRNLLANAVDYTERGGRVVVSSGDGALLDVYDSGPAIAAHLVPRLFERFFRGDGARAGGGAHCGIGLALVSSLCVPLGLTASATNLADGGVRFRLAPLAAGDRRGDHASDPPVVAALANR